MENKTVRTILWVMGLSLSSAASAGMIATPPNCDVTSPSPAASTTPATAAKRYQSPATEQFCQQSQPLASGANLYQANKNQTHAMQPATEPNNLWFLGFCALVVLMPLNRKLINELFSAPRY